ncbi:signal recognition particle 9 kDa protein-domain-containing protein [Terfezia claveryi]|nr:signal recognition particle 9 kDa protein-domain-containing protein [Terfezia claveryi]
MHISPTPQDFLDQSLLLIQARPKTTRITTTYSTTPPPLRAKKTALWLAKKGKSTIAPPTPTTAPTTPQQHTAHLTLKTFDPVSGTTIQFVTREVRDVGRLVGVLGRAARGMGGVKTQPGGDTAMSDAPVPTPTPTPTPNQAVLHVAGADVPRVGSPAPTAAQIGTPGPGGEKQQQQQQQQAGGSGGGQGKGKKKKGKK